MKVVTAEWIAKAEEDFTSAQRTLRARKYINSELACFLAHESAEKYLKARLHEDGIVFEKTLAWKKTVKLAVGLAPKWKVLQPELAQLGPYTQDYLYPGKEASQPEARQAVENCRRVRQVIRTAFGLPV
ncbi:MAG: HEPN domain-containing protein [Acidobacteria bacterium]|nr:HEPN domain-containing protein [Acidobacteriota bacterium]MBI3428207.1 HEPN domain-containing protein [Acidobacteriota bacterium]